MSDLRKKILFVLPSSALPIPATKGGAIETLMTILLNQNEEYGEFEFVFIAPDCKGKKIQYKHSTVYLCESDSSIKYSYDFKAKNIAVNEQPDYIIMEGMASRLDGCFREIIDRKKLAIHVHHEYDRKGVYAEAFGVEITPSSYISKSWNKNNPENFSNTFVLHNSIDTDLFYKQITLIERRMLKKQLGFLDDDFILIFCGRLLEVKGIKQLIQVVNSINVNNIKLIVIGSDSFSLGNKKEFAQTIVNEINNSNERIKYLGYISNEFLYKYYQCADVQVIPSLWNEAFGLVALEGMCSGLPIIFSDSGALPEVIPDKCGIMIKRDKKFENSLKDAIMTLYNDREKCSQMGSNAINISKMYSAHNYYKKFCNLIKWWDSKL